jgi:EAL domain-containing protein (putative c-di-GMP-specific phosphodiesterase class I)
MQVAYSDFTGGQVRAAAHRDIAPDYLKLSPGLVRDIDRHAGRRRQIEEIARAARDMNCDVIAAGVSRSDEAEACRAAGCRYGQGDYFAVSPRISSSHAAPSSPGSRDSRSFNNRRT